MQNKDNQEIKKLASSIVEVKIDGKMSLMSLYDDLPHFEYDLTIENLQNSNTKLKTYIQELKQHITKLENENSRLKTINAVLLKNISSLYKTAYKEIQRKDNIIKELRLNAFYGTSKQVSKITSNNDDKKKKIPTLDLGLKVHQKQIEDINNSEKLKKLNENNDNLTINLQPDKNIPKTIYYKRLCHKFVKENKSMEFKNKIPEEKNEVIVTNKQNPTVELGLKLHKKQIEDIKLTDKFKNLNKNNDDLIINKESDKNIPKTIYYKTSCQKFPKEHETIEFKNKKPEEKNEIITNKQNPTVELVLKLHKKQIKHINSSDESENQNKNNDSLTINKESNENIPKTVCYKRICQNVSKENETIELKNKKPEEIVEINTDKITDSKNKEFTNDKDKSINQYDLLSDTSRETSLVNTPNLSSVNFEVEHGTLFRHSKERKVTMHSTLDNHKQTTRKGRRVQLITIKNNYSQPLISFNGAKETEIDFSKKSIHIEKVVESSSLFYIPQVKKRRVMNFDDCNS